MATKIALAGNPNTGKTTLFNALTGAVQHVGNWPGVTVEKKEGTLKSDKSVFIEDLPGIYSLSPYSSEEVISRNFVLKEDPDVIIDIVDATTLERNLYLATQLCEINKPVVIALNMYDVVEKNGDVIDTEALSEKLGCRVVPISALKKTGIDDVTKAAIEAAGEESHAVIATFSPEVEEAISKVSDIIAGKVDDALLRFTAIKVFERDNEVLSELDLTEEEREAAEAVITTSEEVYGDDSEGIIANERYNYIGTITPDVIKKKVAHEETWSGKVDKIVTNRWLGLPIFALVMWAVYYISVSTIGGAGTDWVNDVVFGEWVPNALGGFLESIGTAEWLYGLIMDGIVAGVGAVLGFLPQMMVLFLCLACLEECGYMARIAFVLDRLFHRFGLSGKSFIPMLIGTGCGVPGIMASRTIENDNDRRLTVMTTTFIPCSAKLPIIALIAGAFFDGSSAIAASSYFVGIAAIIISGVMLKKTKLFAGDPTPFVIELPAYHVPSLGGVLRTVWDRAKAFVKKAFTIILLSTIAIWFLQTFNWHMEMVDTDVSMLASIGKVIAPLFIPLGWGEWRAAVATFTGFIAKENLVSTYGVLYGFAEMSEDGNGVEIWGNLSSAFSPLAGYSLLVFNLLCAPCFAAMGAMNREMMSKKYFGFGIGYQMGFAYVISMIIYQVGLLYTTGSFTVATAVAFVLLAAILYMLFIQKPYTPEDELREKTKVNA